MNKSARDLRVVLCDHATLCRKGLTLAEVVVATMLVALILVGALNGVGGALKMWSVSVRKGEAHGLARQLMSEIIQQEYKESGTSTIGTDGGESATDRSDWDDVDDYDNWSSAPENKNGSAIATYAAWTRAAEVSWVVRDTPNASTGSDTGLKRIKVSVTDPDGATTEVTAWRSDSGMLEAPPEANVTVQSWIGNKLIVDGTGSLENGTVLVNRPE